MNPTNRQNIKPMNLISTALCLGGVLLLSAVYAADDYQTNVLLNPSLSILLAEANGRVMIYDSLKNETVELAMSEQFNRIENMMFVRTQYIQEDGDYEAEEDDCD